MIELSKIFVMVLKMQRQKRKFEGEEKQKEKKLKASEELALELDAKKIDPMGLFLHKIYKGQKPLYLDDIRVEDEKSEKQLTDQVRLLIESIKVDFYKDSIFQKLCDGREIDSEQKDAIYLDIQTLESSFNPFQQLMAAHLKAIPKDDWDVALDTYFSSFTRQSLFSSNFNLDFTRLYERASLYNDGKKYLEKIVFFIQDLRGKNEALIKSTLDELYAKIKVCPSGFVIDLQYAAASLSSDPASFIQNQVFIVCKQLAGDFTNEISTRRVQNPLPAESHLKEISGDNFNDKTHAMAELTDFIVGEKFQIPKSLDLAAKDFFSDEEKDEFKLRCESPIFQQAFIETLVSHFSTLMHGVDSKLKMKNFFRELNLLGDLKENTDTFFDKSKQYKLKESEITLESLKEMIVKRAMKSGVLNGLIDRDVLLLTKCDVILSSVPFKRNESIESQDVFHRILQESKNDYCCVFQDRVMDCVAWTGCEPTISDINKFFKNNVTHVYGISRRDNNSVLYFMQKDPASIRTVSIKNKLLFKNILRKLPKTLTENPISVLKHIDLTKLRGMDPAENNDKSLYLMSKTPFKFHPMISTGEEGTKIFDDIMEKTELKKVPFGTHKIIEHDPKLLMDIQKLSKQNVCDVGYIDRNFLSHSYVSLKMFDKNENIVSFLEYLLALEAENQVGFLLLFKNHRDFTHFFARAFSHIKPEVLAGFFSKNTENKKLLEDAINKDHFDLVKNLIEIKEFSSTTCDENILSEKFWELISSDAAVKMDQFLQLKKYFPFVGELLTHPFGGNVLGIFDILGIHVAAELGAFDTFVILYKHSSHLKLNEEKICEKLKKGLEYLLTNGHFKKIGRLLQDFQQPKFVAHAYYQMHKKLGSFILNYDNVNATNLIKEMKFSEEEKNRCLQFSYYYGNITIINEFITLGGKLSPAEAQTAHAHGVYHLIEIGKYQDAMTLMSITHLPLESFLIQHHPLYQKYQDILSRLVLDPSADGLTTLGDFLKIIDRASAPTDFINHNGDCPALLAAMKIGNIKAIELLLSSHATVDEVEFYNVLSDCITDLRKKNNLQKIAEIIRSLSTIHLDGIDHPLIEYAVVYENLDILQYIAEYSPDALNFCDENGKNALHLAMTSFNKDLIDLLIKKGVSLIKQDEYGDTPLHTAVTASSFWLVQTLIKAGALTNVPNHEARTAFQEASPNLQAYMTLQLLKKYLTSNVLNHPVSVKKKHLEFIQSKEGPHDEKTNWQEVLSEVVQIAHVDQHYVGYLFNLSIFENNYQTQNAYDYFSIFETIDCEQIHKKLASRSESQDLVTGILSTISDSKPETNPRRKTP